MAETVNVTFKFFSIVRSTENSIVLLKQKFLIFSRMRSQIERRKTKSRKLKSTSTGPHDSL